MTMKLYPSVTSSEAPYRAFAAPDALYAPAANEAPLRPFICLVGRRCDEPDSH